ncbi:MAG: ankyrin repeat domain-containing protein [Bacteroidota bacterium]
MKHTYLILIFLFPLLLTAQDENIFLGRAFWKTMPDVAAVKAKVKEGNDPVEMNRYAFDAVSYAILENAPFKTMQYLLSLEGNEVDKITHDGRNYLLWAAYKGNLELMEYLLEKGSDAMLVDDHGYNLICFAAVGGQQDTKVYDLILANGVDVKSTNRAGANALLLLAPNIKDKAVIDYFVGRGLDLHAKDEDGNGMFNYASRKGNIDLMKQLIEMGVAYKPLNKKGENAVLIASQGARGYTNPLATYQFLEELGMELDIVSWEGETPLHNMAYSVKDMAIFDYFMEKGVNVNQVNQNGNTAFLNAARGNNLVAVEKLLPLIKDINQQNEDGYTALHHAVRRNAEATFDLLLSKGADISVLDQKGNNMLYYIFNAYSSRNEATFNKFLTVANQQKLDGSVAFESGNTLAHIAVDKNAKVLLEKAIELGADINQKNNDGLTPLHLAAMKASNEELLTLLLKHGADKSILTDFEESAFDLASENELLTDKAVNVEFLKIK